MRNAVLLLAVAVAGLWAGCKAPEESSGVPVAPVAAPKSKAVATPAKAPEAPAAEGEAKCLVCGMSMDRKSEMAVKVQCEDCDVDCYACRGSCEETFNADPAKYCPKKAAGVECEGGVCPLPEKDAAAGTAKPGAPAAKAEGEAPATTREPAKAL